MAYFPTIAIGVPFFRSFSGITPILDLYPNAAVAYSLRLLRSAYTGNAIRVRRSGDNAESDFGFVNNTINLSSIQAFCIAGGGTQHGFLVTWYDQSGNATNATQPIAANQVQCVTSGVWNNTFGTNTRASFNFDGSKRLIIGAPTALFTYTGNGTVFIPNQVRNLSGSRYGAFISQGSTVQSLNTLALCYQDFPSTSLLYNADIYTARNFKDTSGLTINTNYLTAWKWLNWSTSNSNGNSVIRVNGSARSLTLGGTAPLALGSNRVYIGSNNEVGVDPAATIYAYMPELIAYASDQSANFEGIETNINTYYGIY
jgi:hypothetical protein